MPPDRVGDYLRDLRRLFDKYHYACALYGHFGQGCIHTRIDFDLESTPGIEKYKAFMDDASSLVVSYGGSLSGEHGDGQQPIPIEEQVEVLSFTGDITIGNGEPKVHAHVVLGKADGTAHGGHLLEGHVRPTLEIVITETPRHLFRRLDPGSGLALIDPTAAPQNQST